MKKYITPYVTYLKNLLQFKMERLLSNIIHFDIPWYVHYTSRVPHWRNIRLGKNVEPGAGIANYIQALNGIIFGSNIRIGPNVSIISANHNIDDYDKHDKAEPIVIGNDVWIAANVVILPGVHIGNNVVIGAGSIVNRDIPDNSIAAGNPCKVIKEKSEYKGPHY